MDFYAVLSLTRNASAGEIERAYRRLARRYHPGINPGDHAAAEMFRQVEQAYRILADAAQRQEYDRGVTRAPDPPAEARVSFSGFDFSSPAEGPQAATFSELFADVFQEAARELVTPTRGASIDVTLTLSFEDAVRGGRFPISVDPPRALRDLRRRRSRHPAGGAVPGVPGPGDAAMGPRPHGVHQRLRAL